MLRGMAWLLVVCNKFVLYCWPHALEKETVLKVGNRVISHLDNALPCVTDWDGKYACNVRDLIQSRLFYFKVWEPSVTAFIRSSLKEGDIFVDVGANIGYYTILAAKMVGATGCVIAIEASTKIFSLLQRTVALNGVSNVKMLNVAVSDTAGEIALYSGTPGNIGKTSGIADRATSEKEIVKCETLAGLLTKDEFARARIIKIDIEGMEWPVLKTIIERARELSDTVEILTEISPDDITKLGGNTKTIIETFADSGFNAYKLENEYRLQAYLAGNVVGPKKLDHIPDYQCDLVFSKRKLDA